MNDVDASPLPDVGQEDWERILPATRAAIRAQVESGWLNSHQVPVEEARARGEADRLLRPTPPVASVREETIDLGDRRVRLRIYRPETDSGDVVVYAHGGGWVLGSIDAYDDVARRLCNASACTVVSVDYRRAPEDRFPAALDDVVAAFEWVSAQHPDVAVSVAGDSAGGNLATCTALVLRANGRRLPDHQLLVYPVTTCDLSIGFDRRFQGVALEYDEMDTFTERYLTDRAQAADPLVAPLHADLRGLPPATVVVAECDPIAPQGRLYAAALRDAGVGVREREFPGLVHGFFGRDDSAEAVGAMAWAVADLHT